MAQSFAAILGITGGFIVSRLMTLDKEIKDLSDELSYFKKVESLKDESSKPIEENLELILNKTKSNPNEILNGICLFVYMLITGVFVPFLFLANQNWMSIYWCKPALLILNGIGLVFFVFYLMNYFKKIFKC